MPLRKTTYRAAATQRWMIIGTIRFLHLSPREGGAIERHFGLSARHFSLAPAGYYRQQGTKTGQEPIRDGNQQGQGTKARRGLYGKGEPFA